MCASSRRLPTLPSGARRWEKAHRWSVGQKTPAEDVEQSAAAKSNLEAVAAKNQFDDTLIKRTIKRKL